MKKRQTTDANTKMIQIVELFKQDFKEAVTNILPTKNFKHPANKRYREYQMETSELKNTIAELKKTKQNKTPPDGLNSKMELIDKSVNFKTDQ